MKKKEVFIIAEVGPNHNGSLKLAKKIISLIAKTGVNAVKFQLGNPETVYSLDSFKANYQKKFDNSKTIIEMSKKLQLSTSQHIILSKYCKKKRLIYLCSAFDLDSLFFIDKKLNVPFFKVPSGEINSLDMLEYLGKSKKEIFLSTGMSNFEEIRNSIDIIKKYGNKKITLLHCVSSYPAKHNSLNLNVMDTLREKFKLGVGYSDHSVGYDACLAAVAKGAKIIEKHVTISNNMKGPDHKSSLKISKLKKLVEKIRLYEQILGKKIKLFSNDEINVKNVARKSIVSNKLIKKNAKIKKSDLCFKRPGTGYSPIKINQIAGKIALTNIKANRLILKRHLKK